MFLRITGCYRLNQVPSFPSSGGCPMNPMNPETLTALNNSIQHWERLASGQRLDGEGPYGDCCALCKLFFTRLCTCDGCPVKLKTGLDGCQGSPYWEAQKRWIEVGADSPEFKAAAAKELEFLK